MDFNITLQGLDPEKEKEAAKFLPPAAITRSSVLDFNKPLVGLETDTTVPEIVAEDALKTNPQQFKQQKDLARKTGLPVDVVAADDGSLSNSVRAKEIIEKLGKAPAALKWFGVPENAKAAHQDPDYLVDAAKLAATLYQTREKLIGWSEMVARKVGSGALKVPLGIGEVADVASSISPTDYISENIQRMVFGDAAGDRVAAYNKSKGAKGGLVSAIADLQDDVFEQAGLRDKGAPRTADLINSGTADKIAGVTADINSRQTSIDDVLDKPAFSTVLPFIIETGLISTPEMILSVRALPALIFGKTGTMGRDRAKKLNLQPTFGDFLTVLPYATAAVLLERYAVHKLLPKSLLDGALKEVGLRSVSKAAFKGAVVEGIVTEPAQSTLEYVGENFGTGKGTLEEYGKNILGAVIGGAGVGGGIRAYTAIGESRDLAERGRAKAEQLKSLNGMENSLRDTDPEAWLSLQSSLMEDAGIDGVIISDKGAELLLQEVEGLSAEQLELFTPSTENSATGAGVTVTPEQFWSLPKEAIDKIAEHVSFDATQMSAVDAEEVASLTEMMSERSFIDEVSSVSAEMDENNALFVEIEQRIMQTGGALTADPAAARAAAQQMAAVFTTMSKRTGMPLQKIKDRFLPRIEGATGQPAADGLTQEGGFEAYRKIVDPAGRTIPAEDRPNLRMGDMYGMLPKDAEVVGELDDITLHRGSNGDYYATTYNADLGEQDVVGYIQGRENGTELAVVEEMQGKGIGSELQYLFRRENPLAPTGGLTEAGASRLESTYDRLAAEYMDPLEQSAKEFGVSKEVLRAELDAAGGDITQTPRFKKWFGESKVVDADGNPMVVYHGTTADIFDTFNPAKIGTGASARVIQIKDGFYLTSSEDHARLSYGFNVLPVYASLQNPLIVNVEESLAAWAKEGEELGRATDAQTLIDEAYDGNLYVADDSDRSLSAAVDEAKSGGYDGVIYDYGRLKHEGKELGKIVVALDPNQIKSVSNRGAFDPASDNILYQDGVENKRETKQDERVADKNAHGLMPYLRDYSEAEPRRTKKQALGQTTTNKNARKQLDQVDEILELNPDAHTSAEAWLQMMADAYGTQDVPIAPYRFIEEINGTGAVDNLSRLSEGQIEDANHGFENAAAFREAYASGKLGVETTAKLFLWSFLSRGVSPYTQEALFIDAFPGIDPWIKQAAAGELDVKAFSAWAKTAAPKGSGQPGAGSTHNLNAFGRDFLVKMSQPMEGSNQSKLEYIHELMSDPNSTGQQVRREFAALGEGVGIDNKVVSFTLLVAGYNDVLVLDRVQFRQLYNDGRFDGVNIYDGFKKDGKVVTASGFSKQGDGARGILIYEAMERAVAGRIDEVYTELGREGEGSVGRYHWETWVADSQQEASHGSLGAILPAALGDKTAINKVSAKQGEYGSYAYGARYGVDGAGIGYFTYPTPSGNVWLFTIDQFVEFQQEVRKARNGVVPTKFKVTEAGNAPWYTSEEVNVENLDQLAERISSGKAGDGAGTLFQDGSDQLISDRLPADPALEQQDPTQEVDFVGDVIFEVAPDPNNVELSARWNALPPAAQLAISDTVAKSVLPSVLEAAEAEGSVSPQIGSYLEDTNPSFSLRLTSGDPAAVANAVGFVLSQDSMVALSADAFGGSFEAGAVRIQVGDKSLQEIHAIYQTLRGIEGFPQIGGQSTTDGQMTLILEEGVDPRGFADAVDNALASEYDVKAARLQAAFPEKKDYDYASDRNDPAGSAGVARQRYRAVRVQASQEVAAAIDQYERGGPSTAGQQLDSGARGSIEGARPTDVQDIVIRLYKSENLSTFLHESGHLYLKMLGTLASDATAPQQVKDDFAGVLKFLGVKSEGEIGTAQHEKWAETYEQYLREGKAPSQELRSAFAKFSAWLTTLYRNIKSIGTGTAALNKDIAGVMDRLLATDEQIANVQSEMRMAPMFKDAEAAGMTDEAFAEYKQRYEDARDAAREELVQEAFAETRRERTKWWREELKTETNRVLEGMDTDPAWRTRAIIQAGVLPSGAPLPEVYPPRMKLNKAATAEYGHDLPGGNQLFARDGVSPDRAAQDLGYETGDQMLYELSQLPKDENGRFLTAKQFADQQAQEYMLQEHGDIMNPAEMHEEALMKVHSRRQAQVILDELRLLNRKAGGRDSVTNAAARNAAEQAMSEKTISEIESPTKYLNAERRFSMKAAEAVIAGDIDAALRFKTQQLLNFHMYRTARDMRMKADKMIATLNKRSRQKMDPNRVEPSFITQIKGMVSGIDFSSRMSQDRQASLSAETLQNWADQQSLKYGATFHISPALDRALSKMNVRDFTFSELEGLHDTVKSVYTQGLRYADAQKAQFNSVVQNMGYDIDANAKKKVPLRTGQRTKWEGTKSFVRLAFAEHRHILSLSEELDGYEQNGSVYSNVYQPIKRADDRYIDRSMKAAQTLNKILRRYNKSERLGFLSKKYIPELEGTTNPNLSRNERLAFGLNMGNAGNVAVMKETYTDAQIDAVMATLTDKDVDVIESIWEQIDSYWPELSALEERTTGVKPAKVEPSPFVLPSGRKVKGGYYPLMADPNADRNSKEQYMSSQSLQSFSAGGKTKVSTKHGSTIERQGFGERPVWLDLRGLFEHIDGVVKDIEMREAVAGVSRIIRSKPFEQAVKDAKGFEFYEMFNNWLENTVGSSKPPITTVEKISQYARTGASIAEMGLSVRTMLMQPFGFTNTVALLGEKYAAKGLAEFIGQRGGSVRKVMEASAFMRNRSATFNRDVREANRWMGVDSLKQDVVKAGFWGIQKLDMAVSIPSWLGAYQKSIDEGRSHDDAVDFADQTVSRGQGTGLPRDMADIQQGPVWKKMFTMFYSYFGAYQNMQTDQWKQTNFKNPAQAMKYAKNQMWITIIPSIAVDALFNQLFSGDDDEMLWAKIGGSIMKTLFGGIVFVRDIANVAASGFKFDYQLTPAGNPIKEAGNLAKQIGQGEIDTPLIKSLIMTAGYMGQIPGTRQASRAYSVVADEDTPFEIDEFEGWYRVLVTGPKRN